MFTICPIRLATIDFIGPGKVLKKHFFFINHILFVEKKIKTYINGILAHENIGIDTKIINLYQLGPEW